MPWSGELALVSYGVRIGIRADDPDILDRIPTYLPPGWQPCDPAGVELQYSLSTAIAEDDHARKFRLEADDEECVERLDAADILTVLESRVRGQIAARTTEQRLFVHAGVVSWDGQGIVVPGRSFSGKTTLVEALVRAGATYYSDEFAVFDPEGFVHPYPKRLSVRQGLGKRSARPHAEELGGAVGSGPVPVRLVVLTQYQVGAEWQPQVLSPGHALLEMVTHTMVARTKPGFVLSTLRPVVLNALSLKGPRGHAGRTAQAILQRLETTANDARRSPSACSGLEKSS